jgi:DNA-directed RNA polymerase subunit RPC12/RpoP
MTAITCAKCARRFTPTAEAIQAALAASQGQKHTQLICPHCGKGNKVAPERLKPAARFNRPAPAAPAPPEIPAEPTPPEAPAEPTAEG